LEILERVVKLEILERVVKMSRGGWKKNLLYNYSKMASSRAVASRKAPTPVPASSGAEKSYVAPSSGSTFRVPLAAAGVNPTTLPVGTLCEFLTTTDTTLVAGSPQTAMVTPYRGSATTPGAVAGSQYHRAADVAGLGPADNLIVSGMCAARDGKYWVAYIHSGKQVTIGGVTVVNANQAFNATTEDTASERSSQIILVRYNQDQTVDYVYRRASGGVNYGICGLGVPTNANGRRDLQTNVQVAYYEGTPDMVYVVGQFQGYLNFGNGRSTASNLHSSSLTSALPFAAGFEVNDSTGAIDCRWSTTFASSTDKVSGGTMATPTNQQPVYSGATGLGVTSLGDLMFVLRSGAAIAVSTGSAVVANHNIYTECDFGASAITPVIQFTISTSNAITNGQYAIPIKLNGGSGAINTSFQTGTLLSVSSSSAAINVIQTPLACICHNTNDYSAFIHVYAEAAATYFKFHDVDDGWCGTAAGGFTSSQTAVDLNDGFETAVIATSAAICSDLTQTGTNNNGVFSIVYATATQMYLVAYNTGSNATLGQIDVINVVDAGANDDRAVFVISNGTVTEISNFTIRGLITNSALTNPTLSIICDYATTTSTLRLRKGATSATASSVAVPYQSSGSEYNTVVFSGTITTSANSWTPVSAVRFDQTSAAVVGENKVRGAALIDNNRLVLGIGYYSELSYVNQVGSTVVVPALINQATYPSASLTRNSTNLLVPLLLSTTEGNDRLLVLLSSVVSGAGGKHDANIVPLVSGQIFRFPTSILTPGQNYYASISDGSLTLTRGSNIFLGFAVTATDLLMAGGPKQD
jgi:hypothetical protein